MPLLLAIVGLLLGGIVDGASGGMLGALLGLLVGFSVQQRSELNRLRVRVDALAAALATRVPDTGAAAPVPEAPIPAPTPPTPAPDVSARPPVSLATPITPPSTSVGGPSVGPPDEASPDRTEGAIDRAIAHGIEAVRRFFTTGNFVVRIGVVVLFFGVAFLLRYAYEHAWLPIELRLAGTALGGMALVAAGWRLRHRSDTYGLVLQGAGVGLLYLTIFAAARLYDLLPMTGAFAMLVALVVASAVLAVVQNAQSLAIFAMSGGFLAPVLTSTGTGSHVALFSYYALLNAGILAMAWFRVWRWLNWAGFLFTFVLGTAWGYQFYRPELFASTEPFLLLFFAYYLGVSVLFARQRAVDLQGIVDGTLVFGTPIVAFALQAALVADMPFGLAYSALGAAIVYILLAFWLMRTRAYATTLGRSFLALGVVFATLAIPFAFDDQRWTAASWALEGAGLVWVGLRQRQLLPRVFGALLEVAAGLAFLVEVGTPVADRLLANSAYLGAVILSLAAGFTAFLLSREGPLLRERDQVQRIEHGARWLFLGLAVAWWLAGGAREIASFEPTWLEPFAANRAHEHLFVAFAAASFAMLTWIAVRLRWREALLPGFLLLPLAFLSAAMLAAQDWTVSPLTDLGWFAWPAALVAIAWHLGWSRRMHQARPGARYHALEATWHTGAWWFAALVAAWSAAAAVEALLPDSVWSRVLWGAVPTLALALLLRVRNAERDVPAIMRAYSESYFGFGYAVLAMLLLGWMVAIGATEGNPAPLPYVPLINPVDLVSVALLLVVFAWCRSLRELALARSAREIAAGIGFAGFVWLNLAAARAVHFYTGVPYPVDRVMQSDAFQTTASILWTATALALMGIGARRAWRLGWMVGAALLALVIVKLFTVDLSNLETVARIVSFVTVGLLMLVIGYLAPLPPSRTEDARA